MNEIKTMKKNSKKGFTLVELVVVIAILAILAAIAIPVVSSTITSSQRSSALSNAQTLELAIKEAHAMAEAGDTTVYSGGLSTDVSTIISSKSLQSINFTPSIGGIDYTLSWDATDDKCYYVDGSGNNLDTSVTPGGTPAPLNTTDTLNDLF